MAKAKSATPSDDTAPNPADPNAEPAAEVQTAPVDPNAETQPEPAAAAQSAGGDPQPPPEASAANPALAKASEHIAAPEFELAFNVPGQSDGFARARNIDAWGFLSQFVEATKGAGMPHNSALADVIRRAPDAVNALADAINSGARR